MAVAKFDLRSTAQVFDKAMLRPSRVLLLAFTGLGAFLVLAGIGLGLADSRTVGVVSLGILLAMGGLIVVVGGFSYPGATRAAAELEVSDAGLKILRIDGRRFEVTWGSKRNAIDIADARALPPERKARGLEATEFILGINNIPSQGPIPLEAVLAIIEAARARQLSVTGWSQAPPAWGKQVHILIS